jgi:hypothetical protein
MDVDVASIKEDIMGLLSQDLQVTPVSDSFPPSCCDFAHKYSTPTSQVVSYKWLARQHQINANLAKR